MWHVVWQNLASSGLCPFLWQWYAPGVSLWAGTASLESCSARTQGQDAPDSDFHGVKWMIDSSITEKREREGGTAQHPEAGSPSLEGGEGERLSFTEERCDFPFSLLNSKTWSTRSAVDLRVYRLLWSGHWNISSCGALGGMLYTEFMNKVRFSSCSSKILKV